jgi:hypothetical protein
VRGDCWLHRHHRLHSAGLRPAPGLGWVSRGGGGRGELAQPCRLHPHHRQRSAGLRPAPGLGWVSDDGARGDYRLHPHHRLHSAGLSPASDLAGPCGSAVAPPSSGRSPTAVLVPPTPFPISLHPSLHPCPSRGPILTPHTLTPPGPFPEGDQALLDCGIHQRHLIP